jgi:tetratricopeptide (TPR) repeat protein
MGFLHTLTGSRPEVAIGYCREAAAIAEQEGLEEIGARSTACLAQVLVFAGDAAEARESGERALRVFQARGDFAWACRALAQLIPAANAQEDWAQSLAYCRLALEYARRLQDRRLTVSALVRTAAVHVQRDDWATSLQLCDEALAMDPVPFDAAAIRAVRGYALAKSGDPAAGIELLRQSLEWYEHSKQRYTSAQFRLWLADVIRTAGDLAGARTEAEAVRDIAHDLGYRALERAANRLLARVGQ